jgi:hypothetical protein
MQTILVRGQHIQVGKKLETLEVGAREVVFEHSGNAKVEYPRSWLSR